MKVCGSGSPGVVNDRERCSYSKEAQGSLALVPSWMLVFLHDRECVALGMQTGSCSADSPPGNLRLAQVQVPGGVVHMCRLGVLCPNITVSCSESKFCSRETTLQLK